MSVYTDMTDAFHYKDLLTWQNMDRLGENDNYLKSLVPTGVVQGFAGSSAPAGFLLCDGSAVSRSTYADLFAAIGTTYGAGNGTTTFNLPEGRGRALVGAGAGSGLTVRARGDAFGSETHSHKTSSIFRASDSFVGQLASAPYGHAGDTSGQAARWGTSTGVPSGTTEHLLTEAADSTQPSFVGYWIIKT